MFLRTNEKQQRGTRLPGPLATLTSVSHVALSPLSSASHSEAALFIYFGILPLTEGR